MAQSMTTTSDKDCKDTWFSFYQSPMGVLIIKANKDAITDIELLKKNKKVGKAQRNKIIEKCEKELDEYFQGKRTKFTVRLKPEGSDFQNKVWEQLRQIPYGQHISYGELAKRVGCPKGARACGGANNKNPIMIIIPCHRVMGAKSKLVGFASGIAYQEWLLLHEGDCNFSK